MAYRYSTPIAGNCAKAVGLALPISRKQSVNICQTIRGMNVESAKKLLKNVTELKTPIRFTRYNDNMGHKRGMSSASFPATACKHILLLLKSAEANAQFKGLSTANLVITGASAQKGPTTYHFGRDRTKAKRTHIELVLEERKSEEKAKKTSKKQEAKP